LSPTQRAPGARHHVADGAFSIRMPPLDAQALAVPKAAVERAVDEVISIPFKSQSEGA
jgi:hypothetical protein